MKQIQVRLQRQPKARTSYDYPQVNYMHKGTQRIETHRGCPHKCPFCYEPDIDVSFPIPEIVSNFVEILDMNFLAQKKVRVRIRDLPKTLHGNPVYYEAVCGFDHRFLTDAIARDLKERRFQHPRIAWDWTFKDQYTIKDAIQRLVKAGYQRSDLMVFMITNWSISKSECERKLDLLKVWNVKVCDCCFDGGYKHAVPEFWTEQEIREFRAKCRKHNQLVNFGVDPE